MSVLVSQQVVDADSGIFRDEIFGAKQPFQSDVPANRPPPRSKQQVPKEPVVFRRHESAHIAGFGCRQIEEVAGNAAGDIK